jgi:hypothetical protein
VTQLKLFVPGPVKNQARLKTGLADRDLREKIILKSKSIPTVNRHDEMLQLADYLDCAPQPETHQNLYVSIHTGVLAFSRIRRTTCTLAWLELDLEYKSIYIWF